MKLNDELQKKATEAYKRAGGTDIIRIEVEEDDETKKTAKTQSKNRGQDYDLWPGTRLIGSDNETKHVVNGAILEVIGVDGDTVQIRDIESEEEFQLEKASVAKHTRLRWAVTYPAVQGRTLDGTVRLWDLDSQHFTLAALYIGVSRAKHGSKVSVV